MVESFLGVIPSTFSSTSTGANDKASHSDSASFNMRLSLLSGCIAQAFEAQRNWPFSHTSEICPLDSITRTALH